MNTPQPELPQEWHETDLADKPGWFSLLYRLFGGAGRRTFLDRAQLLASYGWTPSDLEFMCKQPRHLTLLGTATELDEHSAAASAVLADEANRYYASGTYLATYRREIYLAQLHDLGWSYAEIGQLVGLSKQRVQKLVHAANDKQYGSPRPPGSH